MNCRVRIRNEKKFVIILVAVISILCILGIGITLAKSNIPESYPLDEMLNQIELALGDEFF